MTFQILTGGAMPVQSLLVRKAKQASGTARPWANILMETYRHSGTILENTQEQ